LIRNISRNVLGVRVNLELWVSPRVAELRGVHVDGTRSVDLPELALQCGETKAHLGCLSVVRNLQCALVYRVCRSETIVRGCIGKIYSEHLENIPSHSSSSAR